MVITANSALTGENDTYTLYYNTKLVASETETDDDTLDIETEEEYTLQGILVNGEEEFTVSGEMEIESEGDENGQEFSMVASDSFGNQIRFSQEFSTEGNEIEEELNYEFWVLGVKVYAFSVEFETDEDGEELVVKSNTTGIENIDSLFGTEVRYKRTVDEQGRKCVNVKVSKNIAGIKLQAQAKVYYMFYALPFFARKDGTSPRGAVSLIRKTVGKRRKDESSCREMMKNRVRKPPQTDMPAGGESGREQSECGQVGG